MNVADLVKYRLPSVVVRQISNDPYRYQAVATVRNQHPEADGSAISARAIGETRSEARHAALSNLADKIN